MPPRPRQAPRQQLCLPGPVPHRTRDVLPAGQRGYGNAAVLRSQTVLGVDSLGGVKSHLGFRAVNSLAESPPAARAAPAGELRGQQEQGISLTRLASPLPSALGPEPPV